MTNQFFKFIILLASLCFFHALQSEENQKPFIILQNEIKELSIKEYTLSNGLKVYFKQTDFDEDEVMIELFALGGYASLSNEKRASAELSPYLVLQSGIGDFSLEKFQELSFDYSIEFEPVIKPFIRSIEGSAPSQSLEVFFSFINSFFTKPKFNPKVVPNLLKTFNESTSLSDQDQEKLFDENFLKINTQNAATLAPLNAEHLKLFNFEASKKIFEEYFTYPSDFTLVIVGDVSEEKLLQLLEKYIASIPIKRAGSATPPHFSYQFPKGKSHHVIKSSQKNNESLTRIAFPFSLETTQDNIELIEVICQIIETRLRNELQKKFKVTYAIDVAYEFPAFPVIKDLWITLQIRSPFKKIDEITEAIFQELKFLKENGPSDKELATVKTMQDQMQEYWSKDNYFWIAIIGNFKKWGWGLEGLKTHKNIEISKQIIQNGMSRWIDFDNYTLMTLQSNESSF